MTMTKEKKTNIICNIICAVMVVVFMVAFFVLPFWSYTSVEVSAITDETITEERTISLGDYVWFTREHKDLFGKWKTQKDLFTQEVIGNLKDFDGYWFFQSQLVEMPFMATLLAAAGIVFCLWKREKAWVSLFVLASGGCMMYGLMTSYVMQTGQSWLYLVIATGVMLASAVPCFIRWLITDYKWFTVKKRHY